jgi:hypothetical protein
VSQYEPEIEIQNIKTMRRLYRMTLEMPAIDSTGQSVPIRVILRHPCYRSPSLAKLACGMHVGVKPDFLKN